MLDQIPVCRKVWAYYTAILKKQRLSADQLRAIAIQYLMQFAPLEYLDGEILEGLLLSIHRYAVKVCGRCLELLPQSDFTGPMQDRCKSCQRRNRISYQRQWRADNGPRRARYMRKYRATKKTPPPPA
jgi:hypothetical protein